MKARQLTVRSMQKRSTKVATKASNTSSQAANAVDILFQLLKEELSI